MCVCFAPPPPLHTHTKQNMCTHLQNPEYATVLYFIRHGKGLDGAKMVHIGYFMAHLGQSQYHFSCKHCAQLCPLHKSHFRLYCHKLQLSNNVGCFMISTNIPEMTAQISLSRHLGQGKEINTQERSTHQNHCSNIPQHT